MRHVRRHVDEIAGAGFGNKLQLVAPAHARLAADHINHAFHRAVMMRAGLGLGMNHHGSRPQFFRAGRRMGNRRGAVHARCLRSIGVQFVAMHHAYAVKFPF